MCEATQVREKSAKDSFGLFRSLDELPTLNQAARKLIVESMRRTQGNQSVSAKILGITQPTLHYRIKKENLASEIKHAIEKRE